MINLIKHKDFGSIRTEIINEEPWFVAKDVCDVLGIIKHRNAIDRLDEDEKGRPLVVDTLGGRQAMTSVNESGLYNLIFQSRKPEARQFRKWVTNEVLPCIRRYGCYPAPVRYVPQNNKQLGNDFAVCAYRELLKIDSSRVRNRLAALIEFYVSQIQ